MKRIEWKNDYNINIPAIDAQHRRLVELFNELAEAKQNNRDTEKHSRILGQLVGYTRNHFAYEENFMKTINYPLLKEHLDLHKELIEQVVKLLEDYKRGDTSITDKILEIVVNWFVRHILVEDRKIVAYFSPRQDVMSSQAVAE